LIGGARYLDAINESDLYSHPPLEKPIQFLWISGPIKNKTEVWCLNYMISRFCDMKIDVIIINGNFELM